MLAVPSHLTLPAGPLKVRGTLVRLITTECRVWQLLIRSLCYKGCPCSHIHDAEWSQLVSVPQHAFSSTRPQASLVPGMNGCLSDRTLRLRWLQSEHSSTLQVKYTALCITCTQVDDRSFPNQASATIALPLTVPDKGPSAWIPPLAPSFVQF